MHQINSLQSATCKKRFRVSSQGYRATNPLTQVLVKAGTVIVGDNLENFSKDEYGHILHGRYIPRKTLPWVRVSTRTDRNVHRNMVIRVGPGDYQSTHHLESELRNFM